MSKIKCGMNGFGRFGLHLLNYYLESANENNFELAYINDEILDINQALDIIVHDQYVKIYKKFSVKIKDDYLIFNDNIKIKYSNEKSYEISWIGLPDIFLECTGRFTDADLARKFIVGDTKKVLISATSLNADKTLIFGFNHEDYNSNDDVISYGSCTVNAYIVLTDFINNLFSVKNSDVNVIHNIPEYQLKGGNIHTPGLPSVPILRKGCTLSIVAPKLLEYVSDNNFNVNYTLIPYTGVSIIDFRYSLEKKPTSKIWETIEEASLEGRLKGLYSIQEKDNGPSQHQNSKYSAVLIKENSYIKEKDLYINAYFDNENSVNRFFDLTNFLSKILRD